MQRITDVIATGENENGHGFESVVLKDETGAQFQLFVHNGALELVKLEPEEAEAEADEVEADELEAALSIFEEIFGACNDPNCGCNKR